MQSIVVSKIDSSDTALARFVDLTGNIILHKALIKKK
jgi:hypothetical protein